MGIVCQNSRLICICIFYLSLFLCCQNGANENADSTSTQNNAETVIDVFSEVVCRNIDIDSIVNNYETYFCLHFLLVDEPCLSLTEDDKHQIRITRTWRSGNATIVRYEQLKNCWFRTKKTVNKDQLSVFSYLVNEQDITYKGETRIQSNIDFTELKYLLDKFTLADTFHYARFVYIVELLEESYVRKYASDEMLDSVSLEILDQLLL